MQGLGATWHFRSWGALCNLRTDHQTYLRLRGLTCRVRENAIPFWVKSYIGEACSRSWCLIAGEAGSSAGYKKLLLRVRLYGRKARGLRLNFSLDFGSLGILKEQKNSRRTLNACWLCSFVPSRPVAQGTGWRENSWILLERKRIAVVRPQGQVPPPPSLCPCPFSYTHTFMWYSQ